MSVSGKRKEEKIAMKCTRIVIGLATVGIMIIQGYSTNVMANTMEVVVPGSSNPWLAGMPDGIYGSGKDNKTPKEDKAPTESPVLVDLAQISTGSWVEFRGVTGKTGKNGKSENLFGAEGNFGQKKSHRAGAEHGKANLKAPISGLVGFFLNSDTPSSSDSIPLSLDFSSAASREYFELSPLLAQPFWIGDGVTADDLNQRAFVPDGATRLFLGTMDGFNWNNNAGELYLTVATVPEPATVCLLGLGGLLLRRRKHS